jgi:type VI secretion system protein VasI
LKPEVSSYFQEELRMQKIALAAVAVCLLAVILAPAMSARAQDRQAIAQCAAMKGDLDRLTCFDDLAKKAGLAGPQPLPVEVVGIGKWQVQRDKNPVDDSERVMLKLVADSGVSRWGRPVVLYARCQSGKTEVFIEFDSYLGLDMVRLTTRTGSAPAKIEQWLSSTDHKAAFCARPGSKVLMDMAGANKFLVQVVPYSEPPLTAIFDTTGLKAGARPAGQGMRLGRSAGEDEMKVADLDLARGLVVALDRLRADLASLEGLDDFIHEWPEMIVKIRGREHSIVTDSPQGAELREMLKRIAGTRSPASRRSWSRWVSSYDRPPNQDAPRGDLDERLGRRTDPEQHDAGAQV